MYKDGSSICIDKLSQAPTASENGVEVCVSVGRAKYTYDIGKAVTSGLLQISYFSNVYLEDTSTLLSHSFIEEFNTRQIHSFKSFKINSTRLSTDANCRLLMGAISYPIESSMVESVLGFLDFPVDLVCNIGDVDVTPNREQLLYNTKTKETITRCLQKAKLELKEILHATVHTDFNTIDTWYAFVTNSSYVLTLYTFTIKKDPDLTKTFYVEIPGELYGDYGISTAVTINGKLPPEELVKVWETVGYMTLPNHIITYAYFNGKYHIDLKSHYFTLNKYVIAYDQDRLRLLDEAYKPITKNYVKECFERDNICPYCQSNAVYFINPSRLKSAAVCFLHELKKKAKVGESLSWIIEDFRRYTKNIPRFNNSDVPKDYRDAAKANTKKSTARKNIVYTLVPGKTYDYTLGSQGITTDSTVYDSSTVGKIKGTVLYAEKGNTTLRYIYKLFQSSKVYKHAKSYYFVEVAPTNVKLLEAHKNCRHVNTLLTTPNATVKRIATSVYIIRKYKIGDYWGDLDNLRSFSKNLAVFNGHLDDALVLGNYIENLNKAYEVNKFIQSLCDLYINNNWLDLGLISDIETNPELLMLRRAISYYKYNSEDREILITALLFDNTKAYMANKSFYDKVKSIINSIKSH